MWVRIQELSFPIGRSADLINHARNTLVSRHTGDSFRGFRLLVDHPNGHALEVSYWETEADAARAVSASDLPHATLERCNHYELAIDAG
jgi:heme-degrading monooxygenase HmoA